MLILLTLQPNSTKNVTLVTRIEVRIMRLRKEKGDRIKSALQATRDPDVPNNNTGIILSIIPVIILVIIYYLVAALKILIV